MSKQFVIHVGNDGVFTMKDSLLKNSLLLLSHFLQKHYGQKTILLIDEYDVPLDYAYRSGYYDDMIGLVRTLFGAVFNINDSLEFASYLRKTISIRDTNVKKDTKENFYHGVLLGLFANMDGWKVKSNAESGYSDISVEVEEQEIGIIIELKYAENAAFDNACEEALKQINDNNYEEVLTDDGMTTIYRYGISCYKKRCKVVSE